MDEAGMIKLVANGNCHFVIAGWWHGGILQLVGIRFYVTIKVPSARCCKQEFYFAKVQTPGCRNFEN